MTDLVAECRALIKRIDDLLHNNDTEAAHVELHELAHKFEQAADEIERLRRYDAARQLEILRLREANRQLKKSEKMLRTLVTARLLDEHSDHW